MRYADALEQRAREVLPEPVWRYFAQGSRLGVTAAEAVAAWERVRFVPRILRDVTEVDVSTRLLGHDQATPFAFAPTTLQRAAHPDGELAVAEAAVRLGTVMTVSSNAGTPFEQIGRTGARWWLQLYVTADRHACLPVVERAVAAGASAIVLTGDTPVVGLKDPGDGPSVWEVIDPRWLRVNFPAGHGDLPGHEKATDLGPQDIDWLRSASGLPVVVKGVLHPDDARRCLDAGADAVWVSNHGGRQLDGAVSTADVLAGVRAEAAAGPTEAGIRGGDPEGDAPGTGAPQVYVDGGVRTGRHALVAAARGADAVFLGRPVLWALAAGGADTLVELVEALTAEVEEGLRLLGQPRWSDLAADALAPA